MNVRLFANTSSMALTERLEGGTFQPPVLAAYTDIQMRLKLAEIIASVPAADRRPLAALTARIGWPDTAPTSGGYQLEITLGGDTVTTADIAYGAAAAVIQGAINTALGETIAALNPCTVTEYEGLFRIVFADKTQQPTFACVENSLWPASFVDVDQIEFDEGWAYVLQLRQAPVAEVTAFSEEVPDEPEIEEMQAGVEIDGYAINAIQKLTISPAFEGGSFQIVRDGRKTLPLPVPLPAGGASIRDALEPLADEGGAFLVTEVNDGVYIEFTGTMGGVAQDLMTIEVFESPGADYYFHLPTKTDAMRTLMRNLDTAGQVRIPLNLELRIEDEASPDGHQDVTLVQELVFIRPVSTGEHNVAASLRYGQPLSRGSYLRHSPGSLLIGQRATQFPIGDGVATSFALPHNLVENPNAFTANATTNKLTAAGHNYQDLDPLTLSSTDTLPAPLDPTKTYFALNVSADDFQVSLTPNGAAVDLTDTGAGTHTARLKDGTVEYVDVVVWEAAGTEQRVPDSAYTAERTSLDVVTLSGFASTPTSGQYVAVVQAFGRPSTHHGHIHPDLDETPEAKTRIEALEARVAALEELAPGSGILARATPSLDSITRPLPAVRAIVRKPKSLAPDFVFPDDLLGWDPYQLLNPLRAGRLLPAVHDAATEALPSAPLPAPAVEYQGRVFVAGSDRSDFPGGGLKSGDFAACDGREWYRVIRESDSESSYYPAAFELELFRIFVNEYQLTASSIAELLIGFEMAYYAESRNPRDRRTALSWSFKLEFGSPTSDASPGTPGANLDTFFTSPIVALERRLYVTEVPGQHRFGCIVERDAAGDLTASAISYLKEIAATAPGAANFGIRGRLCRFDTEDTPSDARGILAVRGLNVGLDGQPDDTLGRLVIST